MKKIDAIIISTNNTICKNIEKFDNSERGLLSQNILWNLRNFVEHIALKIYANWKDIEDSYANIQKANEYVKTRWDLRFLSKFHRLIQISISHYTHNEENSERLILKYYEYLLKIKSYLKQHYNLHVLQNIDKFPFDTDSSMKEYYKEIAKKINEERLKTTHKERYYIQKIKPFFVEYEVYYEVTFTRASDKISKFDRIIAFTNLDISKNYAVKLNINKHDIEILGKKMPINIIDKWEVSIRPCEINNFSKIFWENIRINQNKEYKELMKYLTNTASSLNEIVNFSNDNYDIFKQKILENTQTSHFINILDKCNILIKNNRKWSNIIKYLLYKLNNKIIKEQYNYNTCYKLSDLYLDFRCIPFDQMPFNSSPINHNPKISDLLTCINIENREHEFLGRLIKNNTEINWELYTPKAKIINLENIKALINTYNSNLYLPKHEHRKLEVHREHIYTKWYEEDTINIIKKLSELSSAGIDNYTNSVNSWLIENTYWIWIDCEEKKESLKLMFEKSKVAFIYGSAWTGKTTIINHISNFFNDKKKLYLANTNPATDNLKRKVITSNSTFKTIASFLYGNIETEFDILIIDECSTVSNKDMLKILKKASFELLILVGDVYQIESIRFGNWFEVAKNFVPKSSIFELTTPYRTKNHKLLDLWWRVRSMEESILEHITKNDYSTRLDDSIFEQFEEEEIILCLNYDWLYWINNINNFLQSNNPNSAIEWWDHVYKVNDPILFNESERFTPIIYNNLKWKIVWIEKTENQIKFEVEIDKTLNSFDVDWYDFELAWTSKKNNSIISFFVNKLPSTDEDDNISASNIVPFQVTYAVSIHKAQGLEYDSVKIVITNEVE